MVNGGGPPGRCTDWLAAVEVAVAVAAHRRSHGWQRQAERRAWGGSMLHSATTNVHESGPTRVTTGVHGGAERDRVRQARLQGGRGPHPRVEPTAPAGREGCESADWLARCLVGRGQPHMCTARGRKFPNLLPSLLVCSPTRWVCGCLGGACAARTSRIHNRAPRSGHFCRCSGLEPRRCGRQTGRLCHRRLPPRRACPLEAVARAGTTREFLNGAALVRCRGAAAAADKTSCLLGDPWRSRRGTVDSVGAFIEAARRAVTSGQAIADLSQRRTPPSRG